MKNYNLTQENVKQIVDCINLKIDVMQKVHEIAKDERIREDIAKLRTLKNYLEQC
jgi:transcriptional regulator of met regulon